MQPLLRVVTVTKSFGAVRAVDAVSFDLMPGEIFALLGPNGAGKTTVVRMLMGILRPDSGRIEYQLGGGESRPPLPAELGYLPEDRGLYKEQPIDRTLAYFGRLRGMDTTSAEEATQKWLERLGLWERRRERLDALSKGNQQKVQFAAAVLHAPRFAVLDEPFSGLDPVNQEWLLQIIHELRASGTTIMLSAHQMNLVERLADRLLLMSAGREALSGTLCEVQRAGQTPRVRLRVATTAPLSELRKCPAVGEIEGFRDGEIRLTAAAGGSLTALLSAAAAHLDIREVVSDQPSLHDLYLHAVTAAEHRPRADQREGQ